MKKANDRLSILEYLVMLFFGKSHPSTQIKRINKQMDTVIEEQTIVIEDTTQFFKQMTATMNGEDNWMKVKK